MADKKISALTAATTPLAGSEVLPIVQGGSTVKVSVDNLTTGKAVTAKSFSAATGLSGATQATDVYVSRTSSTGTVLTGPNIYLDDGTANNTIAVQNGAGYFQVFGYNGSWLELLKVNNSGNVTAPIGNFVVGTAGKGIDFSANAHAPGMTSEVLNWYEEGAFAPSLQFGGGSTGLVYNAQNGWYTRIGNQVTAVIFIQIQQVGSSTGVATIAGLPFTSANVNSKIYTFPVSLENSTGLTGAPFGILPANSSTISIYQTSASGRANVVDTNFQTFALNNIYVVATYMVS